MILIPAIIVLICQLYFIYYIWTELGILWALATMFIPFIIFYVIYMNWHDLKKPFIIQIVCTVIIFAMST
ncbi:MAG: hypothetical protein KDC35_05245 [Acidobacteria bacterium]|nr:hypothetical protein [Acidobacteriota bacterium]